jgi:hypothetical protein
MNVVDARHRDVLALVERGRSAEASAAAGELLRAAERAGLDDLVPRIRLTMAWIDLDRVRAAARGGAARVDRGRAGQGGLPGRVVAVRGR